MSHIDAGPRAAVSVSNARAEASRRNGARSRGPQTPEGKARSAQNALKHGLRAEKHIVLPDEDAAEFAELEAAMIAELAPEGALQTVLARRVAVAAWRLARADRLEVELFAERSHGNAGPALALLGRRVGERGPNPFRRPSDGNGTRSFETLLRYRAAAMAEFWRALRTLKALQAERAATPIGADLTGPAIARRRAPDEPERLIAYVRPEPPTPGPALHEPAAPAAPGLEPDEPDSCGNRRESRQPGERANPGSRPRERDAPPSHVRPCRGRGPHPPPGAAMLAARATTITPEPASPAVTPPTRGPASARCRQARHQPARASG
jgi:hypothetical protein